VNEKAPESERWISGKWILIPLVALEVSMNEWSLLQVAKGSQRRKSKV